MTESISALADVSTMWLVLLSFILCLIPLALVGGMVFGMYKLLGTLPQVLRRGQEGVARVGDGVDQVSKRVAAPFIAVSASASQAKGMLRSVKKISRR